MHDEHPHLGWYFAPKNRRLRYGDNRLVETGVTHTVDLEPRLCNRGLHWSKNAIDALIYAPGPIACRVEGGGKVIVGRDKSVGTSRTYLAVADASDVLYNLARNWALDVADLWDAPKVVLDYLRTGDVDLAAGAAAEAAGAARAAEAAGAAAEAAGAAAVARAAAPERAVARAAWAAAAGAAAAERAVARAAEAAGAAAEAAGAIKNKQNNDLETALVDLLRL